MNDTVAARLAEIREAHPNCLPDCGYTFLLRLLDAAQAELTDTVTHAGGIMAEKMLLQDRVAALEQALGEAHSIIGSNLLHDALGPITQWYNRTSALLRKEGSDE